LSVRAQRQRQEQFERERAVVQMREAVVSAVAPAYVGRVGSSSVYEAVDEALAQIVVADGHLGEPEQVKALWITCARRRLIDELRSAEAKHRDATPVDDTTTAARVLGDDDLSQLTDDARQEWRIREILSVLRGDQRRWAEAWYDEVLSGSRPVGAQPRGLGDALGWSPSKTKSVSQRARKRMASFIDDRTKGVICDEQRVLLDAYVTTGRRRRPDPALDDERYEAALVHVAGCEDCFAAWHIRRRSLPVRCGAIAMVPIDGVTNALHGLSAKATCLAMGAYGQAASLLGRLGIGGAAAGGGIASLGGKATAVCVGVVCAATAGGEIAGVIPPIPIETAHQTSEEAAEPKPADTTAEPPAAVVPPPVAPVAPPAEPPTTTTTPPPADPQPVVEKPSTETPGDLPSTGSTGSTPASAGGSSPNAESSQTSGGNSGSHRVSKQPSETKKPNCVPGDLGC
jgi:DNA-directed RNA polymerase specialized sigma24 family protein